MPASPEQAAEGPADAGHGPAEPAAAVAGDEPTGAGPPAAGLLSAGRHPAGPAPAGKAAPRRNRAATVSLLAGILGITGLGAVLGVGFGVVGLAHAARLGGRVRCWVGITLSLLWLGGIGYVVPHVIKAADPGCTAFKERALPRYNTAIGDFDRTADTAKTTSDLGRAIASLRVAAGESGSQQPRAALASLAGQLARARADASSGQVPGSVMQALNHDAAVADNACGTI
jgi:hypothetical protein